MRAIVLDEVGRPEPRDLPVPSGEKLRVLACGLCGSDVEKLGPESAGLVLGHEVVAETEAGSRVVPVHHLPCGDCERCQAGHESTCERFRAATIRPGGFAEQIEATGGWVDVPDSLEDSLATYAEPLGCVLRGAERVPRGDVLVLGGGFIGTLFAQVLRHRGDRVHVYDSDPKRSDGPPSTASSVVVTAPADPLAYVEPGGFVLVFAPAPALDLAHVYRDELTVAGSRSATPRHLEQAVALLPELELPAPTVLPLERFDEGVALYRSRAALKVVFTP